MKWQTFESQQLLNHGPQKSRKSGHNGMKTSRRWKMKNHDKRVLLSRGESIYLPFSSRKSLSRSDYGPQARRATEKDLFTWWPIQAPSYIISFATASWELWQQWGPNLTSHHRLRKGQTKNAPTPHAAPSSQSVSRCCRSYYCSSNSPLLAYKKKGQKY